MTLHFLNGFTCNAYVPSHWRTGALCLLVETNQGPVLVDTGLGQEDYVHKTGIIRAFQVVTRIPLDPEEAAVRQIARFGFNPRDVRHVVLTHMHFDHCGGLPDFPWAAVHVHRREHQAFVRRPRHWAELAYVRRHVAHRPAFVLYDDAGERWFDWTAIRLPFEPEMWLVPLFGHTRGHCGVAVQTESGWLFHVGDAAAMDESLPGWLTSLVLGPHTSHLHEFRAAHPQVRMTAGHVGLEFFGKASGSD